MAKRVYIGVNDKARRVKRVYLGINNIARKVKKIYIGVGNVARLCYTAFVNVTYKSSKALSFTSKEVEPETAYGAFPTISQTIPSGCSGRVDFWFHPNATAKYDSSKKYIDYPWCAYADAHPDLYSQYGYAQDLLAKHWYTDGRVYTNWPLGTLTADNVCTLEDNHELQHVYRPLRTWNANHLSIESITGAVAWEIKDSKGNVVYAQGSTALGYDQSIFPGMTITAYGRWFDGLTNVGADGSACGVWLGIDGGSETKKTSGVNKTFTYTVPNNVYKVRIELLQDRHWDGGESWQVHIWISEF